MHIQNIIIIMARMMAEKNISWTDGAVIVIVICHSGFGIWVSGDSHDSHDSDSHADFCICCSLLQSLPVQNLDEVLCW